MSQFQKEIDASPGPAAESSLQDPTLPNEAILALAKRLASDMGVDHQTGKQIPEHPTRAKIESNIFYQAFHDMTTQNLA